MASNGFWGCAVKRSMIVLLSTVTCAVVLALGMTGLALAEDELPPPAETWQVRTIPTPVAGVQPSFIAAENGRFAWTGVQAKTSKMFVYNLTTGTNVTVPTGPGDYYNPSADGPWVVFQGRTIGAYDDIYLYDTGNGEFLRITNNAEVGDGNDWNPRVDGNRIVWQKDATNAAPGIYLYSIAYPPTRSLLIPGEDYRNPDIWGDWVVCVKNDQTLGVNGSEIVLYNLLDKSMKSIAVDTGTMNNDGPCIDNGWVVWASGNLWEQGGFDPWNSYQINLYRIETGETFQLTNDVAGNFNPSIEGTTVAWETKLPNAIWTYDVESGKKVQVSRVTQVGEVVRSPDVDGSTIAWYSNTGLFHAVRSSEATRFPDVPADHPYYTAIEGMAEREIIQGYQNGNFGPADPVIRQQFAKMIVLTMAEYDPVQFTPTTNDTFAFTDSDLLISQTPSGELYPYHYVSKAALTGLTVGYTDGSFKPANRITRQQVITMIVRAGSRALQPPPSGYRGVLSYSDPTHGQNIRLAEYNGILEGIIGPSGTLTGWDTTGFATRGEVAQMLWNLLGVFGLTEVPE